MTSNPSAFMTPPPNPARRQVLQQALATLTVLSTTGCATQATGPDQPDDPLRLDTDRFVRQTLTVNGQTLVVRAYENRVTVRHPVAPEHQALNLYVPEAYFLGERIGRFDARSAPIFLPNGVGGYMPALPRTSQPATQGPNAGQTSTIARALAQGFVVASPGARGRTLRAADGRYTGKAPAAILDLKAAVRYLRHNAGRFPGDVEKIVSNGTSAGGGLSALLGASGNHPDYDEALQAMGAAPGRDDVFAVSAYCPITDLEHADAAYEWQYGGVNDYRKIEMSMLDFNAQRREVAGTLDAAQIALSADLRALFPAYLNSLALRDSSGQALTLDATGQGSFREHVRLQVLASAQAALDAGTDLGAHRWLRTEQGRVTALDFDAYVRHAGRMKPPPAFDALDRSSGENQLFGNAQVDTRHFTSFSAARSTVAGAPQADARTVRMMNPLSYIGTPGARTAAHWRIRHGTLDRDTALAVPVLLATRLRNRGHAVDLALPWDRPHSGDYDLDQLFAWMANL